MDTMTIVGIVAVAGALLFAMLYQPGRKLALPAVSIGRQAAPGRALIDHIENAAKDGAGEILVAKVATHKANELAEQLSKSFSAPAEPPKA